MKKKWRVVNKGFTIVELLIVVVVIAVLAAITIVSYNGIRARANDAKRAQDIATIEKTLIMHNELNGGVPRVAAYYTGGSEYSGWDTSVDGRWLSFLTPAYGKMPVDPVNTITPSNNPPGPGNLNYYYHCYGLGNAPGYPTPTVILGYHKQNGVEVRKEIKVTDCL